MVLHLALLYHSFSLTCKGYRSSVWVGGKWDRHMAEPSLLVLVGVWLKLTCRAHSRGTHRPGACFML